MKDPRNGIPTLVEHAARELQAQATPAVRAPSTTAGRPWSRSETLADAERLLKPSKQLVGDASNVMRIEHRLLSAPGSTSITADLGKAGSAFFLTRLSWLTKAAFPGFRCTTLHAIVAVDLTAFFVRRVSNPFQVLTFRIVAHGASPRRRA
jgi:hypothetical protein